MIHIRPRQVFAIDVGPDEGFKAFFPPLNAGSLTVLESAIMVRLLKYVQPQKVFEFGTFMGHTTRLLLENLPDNSTVVPRIFTVDLPSLEDVDFEGSDKLLAMAQLNVERKYIKSAKSNLVFQLLIDSKKLDIAAYHGEFEYIFVDGNHEISYAISDTEKSFKMASLEKSCIIWHDYGNPEFSELTEYLNSLSQRIAIYHVEDTMLAFHLRGMVFN